MAYERKPFKQDDELNLLEIEKDQNTTYKESGSVTDSRNAWETYRDDPNNKPGEWDADGTYTNAVKGTYDAVFNRPQFTYDVNGDALYQQYKDKYINQGRLAMADTIGQASAMTGGYGSSYATTAGSQAYQSHLQNLNDIVPQLYEMAYNKYTQEGQDLMNQYSLASDMYNRGYGEWRDSVSDYNTNVDRLYGQYVDERNYDYGVFDSNRTYSHNAYYDAYNKAYQAHWDNEDRLYQEGRDRIADEQWQKSYNLQVAAANRASETRESIEGLSQDDIDTLESLLKKENYEAIDRYIGSLALSEKARNELFDIWLPDDYGTTPKLTLSTPWYSHSIN
jgi:hypothetical protein